MSFPLEKDKWGFKSRMYSCANLKGAFHFGEHFFLIKIIRENDLYRILS